MPVRWQGICPNALTVIRFVTERDCMKHEAIDVEKNALSAHTVWGWPPTICHESEGMTPVESTTGRSRHALSGPRWACTSSLGAWSSSGFPINGIPIILGGIGHPGDRLSVDRAMDYHGGTAREDRNPITR